jgi:hypothetical protein
MELRSKSIDAQTLRELVRITSDETYAGNLYADSEDVRTTRDGTHIVRFRLRVLRSDEKGAHISASGRRTVSACWHANRDAMRIVFATDPAASISSALARYTDRDHFLTTFPRTYYSAAGSQARPIHYGKLCACGQSSLANAVTEIRDRPYADGFAHLARFA